MTASRAAAALFLAGLVGGCAAELPDEEKALVESVAAELGELHSAYPELADFRERRESGRDFVSFSARKEGISIPVFDPGRLWFKVSLSERPVDPGDLQPPLVTVNFPQFGKYLKLRVRSANKPLLKDLVTTFLRRVEEEGGTDVRFGFPRRMGAGRAFPGRH